MRVERLDDLRWLEQVQTIEKELTDQTTVPALIGNHPELGSVLLVRTPDGAVLVSDEPFIRFLLDRLS